MNKILIAMLACFLSFSSLQAETVFAYVYNDNTKVKGNYKSKFGGTEGYLVKSPIIFNSKTARAIDYDAKTGELIVPSKGAYEVVYSIIPNDQKIKYMSLAVNSKEVLPSRMAVTIPLLSSGIYFVPFRPVTTATYVLTLQKNDRVSLILPLAPKNAALFAHFSQDAGSYGHSASLYVKKL